MVYRGYYRKRYHNKESPAPYHYPPQYWIPHEIKYPHPIYYEPVYYDPEYCQEPDTPSKWWCCYKCLVVAIFTLIGAIFGEILSWLGCPFDKPFLEKIFDIIYEIFSCFFGDLCEERPSCMDCNQYIRLGHVIGVLLGSGIGCLICK